jgi:ribonuclease G
MSEDILVNVTPQETRVAVVFQGVVQEIHIEREANRGLVGNVYLGKVVRVLPGMQSAFVDVGMERAAFLHVADIWEERHPQEPLAPSAPSPVTGSLSTTGPQPTVAAPPVAPKPAQAPPRAIERILHEGQSLLVQVIKDPIGTKGARLSTQISVAGRMLVYLPQESHIGISQRIENEAERALLRDRVQQLMPPEEKGGFIVRTMAEAASDADLANDVAYLRKLWHNIREAAQRSSAPTCLYQDLGLLQRTMRDLVLPETATIQCDSREHFVKLKAFAEAYTPNVLPKLVHYTGERPLFDLYGVEQEIEKALARRVDLKSGGYLIIDQTEALTTADVNTGGFVGVRSFDDTIFKTNLEAAQAIARQLRLRNLGGIIIVDFIDMVNEDHKASVLAELNKALSRDRTKMSVNGFTQLGLVEMTRKRTRESLAHVLCEPCATCGGRGEVKTARTVCYEILRELSRESKEFNPREFRILAAQSVIDLFLEDESQALATLSDMVGKPISLAVEGAYTQEQYDIVLM